MTNRLKGALLRVPGAELEFRKLGDILTEDADGTSELLFMG